jgi:hypothetical protein
VLSWLRAQVVAAVVNLLFEELEATISMQPEVSSPRLRIDAPTAPRGVTNVHCELAFSVIVLPTVRKYLFRIRRRRGVVQLDPDI